MRWLIGIPRLERPIAPGCALAIGVFDGVHLGHQALIAEAVRWAREHGTSAVALTFDPHPSAVVYPNGAPSLLCTLPHRVQRLQELGIDLVVVLPFTQAVAELSPQAFIQQMLVEGLGVGAVVVGEDFRFGHQRAGDVETLRAIGGFEVCVVPPVEALGERVSSTRVRHLVRAGEMEAVQVLLGEPFQWEGIVVFGEARGRRLGYPTANLDPYTTLVYPPDGVYACRAEVDGRLYPAAVSVGKPPMFESAQVTVEAHLIDFPPRNLYGRVITLQFLKRLRDLQLFNSLDALLDQMEQDVETTRRIYENMKGSG